MASKDHAGPKVSLLLARVPGAELKSLGSSLKFCLVAEGKADLYLRDLPTMEWDTAAAQCIVEAAGGSVKDITFNHIFLADMSGYAAMNEVYREYFPENPPARYCIRWMK